MILNFLKLKIALSNDFSYYPETFQRFLDKNLRGIGGESIKE